MRVGENQKKAARKADLYGFLLKYHPNTVKPCGHNRLQNIEHDSLIITKNLGFVHNSIHKSGNSIDYLMKYLNYNFTEAVAALAAFEGVHEETVAFVPQTSQKPEKGPFEAPKRMNGAFTRTFAYLTNTRKIDAKIVQDLINKELLYEEDIRHNAIFFSKHHNYAEIEGTLSNKKFKGSAKNPDEGGFWLYVPECSDNEIKKIYVCESAIDAVSLYQIQKQDGEETRFSGYLSIGGAAKDSAFEQAKKDFPGAEFVAATDDDTAGNNFAARHGSLKRLTPKYHHDWNEELTWAWTMKNVDLPY